MQITTLIAIPAGEGSVQNRRSTPKMLRIQATQVEQSDPQRRRHHDEHESSRDLHQPERVQDEAHEHDRHRRHQRLRDDAVVGDLVDLRDPPDPQAHQDRVHEPAERREPRVGDGKERQRDQQEVAEEP